MSIVFKDRSPSLIYKGKEIVTSESSVVVPEDYSHIAVTSNDEAKGTVSGGGVVTNGTRVQLKAKPAQTYALSHWAEDGEPVAYGNEYTFEVDRSRNIEAVFDDLYIAGRDWWSAKPSNSYIISLAYGNGVWLVIVKGWTSLYRSSDAKTWDAVNLPDSPVWLTFDGERFILLYSNTVRRDIYVSNDGLEWDKIENDLQTNLGIGSRILFINGLYFRVSTANYNFLNVSEDLVSWTNVSFEATAGKPIEIFYGNEHFVLLTHDGYIWASKDGLDWSGPILSDKWESVTYDGEKFWTARFTGTSLQVSSFIIGVDGNTTIVQNPVTVGTFSNSAHIEFLDGVLFVLELGTRNVWISYDEKTWTLLENRLTNISAFDIAFCYGDGWFADTTTNGFIYTTSAGPFLEAPK